MDLLTWMFVLAVSVIGIGIHRKNTKKKYGVFNTGIGMMMVVVSLLLLTTDPYFISALNKIVK